MVGNRPVHLSPACVKTLSKVEADKNCSNQHEFNGVSELKVIFGTDKLILNALFSVRGQNLTEKAEVTWYEAREKHPTRSEYRLYFKSNIVMNNASVGDDIIIGFDSNQNLHCILIKRDAPDHNGNVTTWTLL